MLVVLATLAAKLTRVLVRLSGRGQGSSLPGLVALRIDRRYLEHGSGSLKRLVVVAGTNGKTTTARLIAATLRADGSRVVANTAGANMASGVAAALAEDAPWFGRPKPATAVIESDEDALPGLLKALPSPAVLVMTNLFRDQLDRYGEVDSIARRWTESVADLAQSTELVVNANDPRLVLLSQAHKGPRSYFGVDDASIVGTPNQTAADAVRCPQCGGALGGQRFMAHLGVLRCRECAFATPRPDVALTAYKPSGFESSLVTLLLPSGALDVQTTLIGRYNALNIATAAAAARALHTSRAQFLSGVAAAGRAFGRGEHFTINGRAAYLHLAKNPTGYNEVLRGILDIDRSPHLLLALNDNWADGQDVSWIWDVDFESVAPAASTLATTGQRAGDLAVRLDVAGATQAISLETEVARAFDRATADATEAPLHVIASYTALLMLRAALARRHLVPATYS